MAALALAGVALASGTLSPAGAANRYQLSHPTRALPVQEEQSVAQYGFTPQDLRELLAEGVAEGIAPNGNRVILTLNEQLQRSVFELFRQYNPDYGVFAAMEPATGRIAALVGYRRGGESDPWLPLKAIYPAASLFKVVTAAAALEMGTISPEDEIAYRGGIYRITRKGIRTRGGRGIPTMSLEEAIAKSANSVFGKVAVNYVGSDGLEAYMEKFGFGQPIPFGLPVETSRGEVPKDEYNLARTGAGFGEVYVSPLHMAMIMSAIASSGEMPFPYLIGRVVDNEGKSLYEGKPVKWRDTVKPETARTLLRMMVKTIEMGTSRRTFGSPEKTPLLQDMEVAGKTGSLSGWTPRRHFEWFAGVAPVDGPKLAVVALVVNDGKWKIKGSYVGKEAFNAYFGYPSTDPPVYRKARWGKKGVARKGGKKHLRVSRKRVTKSAAAVNAPDRAVPLPSSFKPSRTYTSTPDSARLPSGG